jgi:cystathionine beta-lyase
MQPSSLSPATQCVHTGTIKDERFPGMNTPVYTSTAYQYGTSQGNLYPRYFNIPNHQVVVEKLCALEGGGDGMLFSSGTAAISTTLLGLLKSGDHVVFQRELYGGTHHLIVNEMPKFGIEYTFVDGYDAASFPEAIRAQTKMIFIETPSNPLLKIVDIGAVARLAREKKLISVIDNTFASPINQNPIRLGIDVVVHSGTKYLGGHSDLSCGAVIGSVALLQKIRETALNLGGNLNAQTCYLLERSLKTLALRVKQQNTNALQLAQWLETQVAVTKVYYPGLVSHPGHAIARSQMSGFGGMLSFELNSGLVEPDRFLHNLRIAQKAMSLGGVETTLCSPALTSHVKMTTQERADLGITDPLLRVSVGIEEVQDLIDDFKQAMVAEKMLV